MARKQEFQSVPRGSTVLWRDCVCILIMEIPAGVSSNVFNLTERRFDWIDPGQEVEVTIPPFHPRDTNALSHFCRVCPYGSQEIMRLGEGYVLKGTVDKYGTPALPAPDRLSKRVRETGLELSPRDRQIIKLIAEGNTTKEIAAHLGVAYKTAEFYRSRISKQLGIRNAADMARFALEHQIIQLPKSSPGR